MFCKFGENRFSGLYVRSGYGHTDILKTHFYVQGTPKRIFTMKTQNRFYCSITILSLYIQYYSILCVELKRTSHIESAKPTPHQLVWTILF